MEAKKHKKTHLSSLKKGADSNYVMKSNSAAKYSKQHYVDNSVYIQPVFNNNQFKLHELMTLSKKTKGMEPISMKQKKRRFNRHHF